MCVCVPETKLSLVKNQGVMVGIGIMVVVWFGFNHPSQRF